LKIIFEAFKEAQKLPRKILEIAAQTRLGRGPGASQDAAQARPGRGPGAARTRPRRVQAAAQVRPGRAPACGQAAAQAAAQRTWRPKFGI